MHAHVLTKVDQLRGLAHRAHGGFQNIFGLARKRNHAAMMIHVAAVTQNEYARPSDHRRNFIHHSGISAFREIRYTFNHAENHCFIEGVS